MDCKTIIYNPEILIKESITMDSSSTTSSFNTSNNDDNKSYWLLGDTVTFKLRGHQTGGKYSVWEIKAPSQSGPPSHYHTNLEESFYVLDGEFSFQDNENVINATTAGSFIHVKRGIIHTYKNIGKSTGRLLVIGLPAGFENFVQELGIPSTNEMSFVPPPSTSPDLERIDEIAKKHGIIFVPGLPT
jgi:quercetin dioxygenase-like cupin family protein